MTTKTIRCRSNGTIDIEFYRARAAHERRIKMRVYARKLARTVRRAAVSAWRWMTPPSHPLPDPGAVMLIAGAAARNPRF